MKRLILILSIIYITSVVALATPNLILVGFMKTNFVVTDPFGRKAGYDISINQPFSEIPKSYYQESGYGDSDASIRDNFSDNFYEFIVENPVDGLYKIKVIGMKLGKIHLSMSYERPLGSPKPKTISYISDVNKVDYFEINYSYATGMAGQVMPVTHIASSSTLIDDINVMQKMGYIGDAHFVSETIEKINEIEKERLEPQKPDDKSDKDKKKDDKPKLTPAQKAKKEYTELLKEITEKYNKPESDEFVKQEAYTVLKEDLEYIINHL